MCRSLYTEAKSGKEGREYVPGERGRRIRMEVRSRLDEGLARGVMGKKSGFDGDTEDGERVTCIKIQIEVKLRKGADCRRHDRK